MIPIIIFNYSITHFASFIIAKHKKYFHQKIPRWHARLFFYWRKGENHFLGMIILQAQFFNVASMLNRPDYLRKEPLKLLNDFALRNGLSQLVDFCTWSRTIKSSVSTARARIELRIKLKFFTFNWFFLRLSCSAFKLLRSLFSFFLKLTINLFFKSKIKICHAFTILIPA